MIKTAVSQGAVLRCGGKIPELPEPLSKGSYYAPTILEVGRKMSIWKEEVRRDGNFIIYFFVLLYDLLCLYRFLDP